MTVIPSKLVKMNRQVIDNFLSKNDHMVLYDTLSSSGFPWYVKKEGVSGTDLDGPYDYYFTHTFYSNYQASSDYMSVIEPIIKILSPKAIVRIKANLYPRTEQINKHGIHQDQNFNVRSCLFYVNDNNGVTTFEDTGEEIKSVANRALLFNSYDNHCSSTCSDQKFRLTINFNYF